MERRRKLVDDEGVVEREYKETVVVVVVVGEFENGGCPGSRGRRARDLLALGRHRWVWHK
jgi:hypothetical protein